jgi:ATP-dependent DNA helicase PIF1
VLGFSIIKKTIKASCSNRGNIFWYIIYTNSTKMGRRSKRAEVINNIKKLKTIEESKKDDVDVALEAEHIKKTTSKKKMIRKIRPPSREPVECICGFSTRADVLNRHMASSYHDARMRKKANVVVARNHPHSSGELPWDSKDPSASLLPAGFLKIKQICSGDENYSAEEHDINVHPVAPLLKAGTNPIGPEAGPGEVTPQFDPNAHPAIGEHQDDGDPVGGEAELAPAFVDPRTEEGKDRDESSSDYRPTGKSKDRVIGEDEGLKSLATKKDMQRVFGESEPVKAHSLHYRARFNNRILELPVGRAYCIFAIMVSCFPPKRTKRRNGLEEIAQKKKGAKLGEGVHDLFYTSVKVVDGSTYLDNEKMYQPVLVEFFATELEGIPPALNGDTHAIIGIDYARVSFHEEGLYINANSKSRWAIFSTDGSIIRGYNWKQSKKYSRYLHIILDLEKVLDGHRLATLSDLYVYDEIYDCSSKGEHDAKKENDKYTEMMAKCNDGQSKIVAEILAAYNKDHHRAFFIDAPAGTGKSFVLNTLIHYFNSISKGVLQIASSGVAAQDYPEGRTAHSALGLPFEGSPNCECEISKGTSRYENLINKQVVIWDEVASHDMYLIQAADRALRKIYESDMLLGGRFVIFAGDFRQTLPIIRGKEEESEKRALKYSYIWDSLKKLSLYQDMRATPSYALFTRTIGEGNSTFVVVPQECMCLSLEDLINEVFPNIQERFNEEGYLNSRSILCPYNAGVDFVNNIVLSSIPIAAREYPFKATTRKGVLQVVRTPLTLIFKVGCPYIVLKNLRRGICNGTRCIGVEGGEDYIKLRATNGIIKGQNFLVHRVQVSPEKMQFPIAPCFSMSINKAQGQTLDMVGINLSRPVFAAGQLYVAFTRGRDFEHVKVYSQTAEVLNKVAAELLKKT